MQNNLCSDENLHKSDELIYRLTEQIPIPNILYSSEKNIYDFWWPVKFLFHDHHNFMVKHYTLKLLSMNSILKIVLWNLEL